MKPKPMTIFVNGPINATLPNLDLSDNPIMTAPGAINLKGMNGIADMAVTIMPYKSVRNSAHEPYD